MVYDYQLSSFNCVIASIVYSTRKMDEREFSRIQICVVTKCHDWVSVMTSLTIYDHEPMDNCHDASLIILRSKHTDVYAELMLHLISVKYRHTYAGNWILCSRIK